ncbi:carbohydrate ABC transporter permease [Microbacterium sp. 2MCAF23]
MGLAFITPKFLVFGVFVVLPFVYTFILMFQSGDVLMGFHFVGFRNIASALVDPAFLKSLLNTLWFWVLYVPASLVAALLIGSLFGSDLRGRSIYRALIYIPSLLSVVGVGLIWRVMLDPDSGPLNSMFRSIGLSAINPFASGDSAMVAVALVSVWAGAGFGGIVIMAALNDIPSDLLEAAQLDGAGPLRVFMSIKLPLLKPVIQFLAIVNTITAIQVFDIIFVLTKGGPGTATSTAMWYIYSNAFKGGSVGYAATMSVALLVVTAAISVVFLRLSRRATA